MNVGSFIELLGGVGTFYGSFGIDPGVIQTDQSREVRCSPVIGGKFQGCFSFGDFLKNLHFSAASLINSKQYLGSG